LRPTASGLNAGRVKWTPSIIASTVIALAAPRSSTTAASSPLPTRRLSPPDGSRCLIASIRSNSPLAMIEG
jgi:hypothetical protein